MVHGPGDINEDERHARAALTALVEPGELKIWEAANRLGAVELLQQITKTLSDETEPLDLAKKMMEARTTTTLDW